MKTFFCQNACGEVGFSITEWNEAYQEVKDLSEEMQRLVLDSPDPCWKSGKPQCFSCIAIVGETRNKNSRLTGKAQESPRRQAYLNWVKAGKPKYEEYILK